MVATPVRALSWWYVGQSLADGTMGAELGGSPPVGADAGVTAAEQPVTSAAASTTSNPARVAFFTCAILSRMSTVRLLLDTPR
jgi:hypothetical protein